MVHLRKHLQEKNGFLCFNIRGSGIIYSLESFRDKSWQVPCGNFAFLECQKRIEKETF